MIDDSAISDKVIQLLIGDMSPNRCRWIQPHTTFDYIKPNDIAF